MRRRAGVVRASKKECRNRRRHEEESRSSKGEWGEECRDRGDMRRRAGVVRASGGRSAGTEGA